MRWILLSLYGLFVGSLIFNAGCNVEVEEYTEYTPASNAEEDHDHEHGHGPHDGHVIELGEDEYHAELVFDESTQKLTVYILDSAAESSVAVEEDAVSINLMIDGTPTQFSLESMPQEGDPEGKSSRFELSDEQIAAHIPHEEDLEGRLNVTIDGRSFLGTISHEGHDHDHEEHDHEHEEDHAAGEADH